MKEITNYKNIRKKPYIYGFTPMGFYIFVGIGLISLFSFAAGVTFTKVAVVGAINFVSFVYTKYFIGDNRILKYFMDQKFPKEISDLTKNKSKK